MQSYFIVGFTKYTFGPIVSRFFIRFITNLQMKKLPWQEVYMCRIHAAEYKSEERLFKSFLTGDNKTGRYPGD